MMRHFGAHTFAVLPLRRVAMHLHIAEQQLIRQFSPSMNTVGVLTHTPNLKHHKTLFLDYVRSSTTPDSTTYDVTTYRTTIPFKNTTSYLTLHRLSNLLAVLARLKSQDDHIIHIHRKATDLRDVFRD